MHRSEQQATTEAAVAQGVAALRAGRTDVLAAVLRTHLREHVLPFWTGPAWDEATGTLATCIDDRGAIQSEDRWLWSQWRAVWVFSRLYRTVDADPRHLERARQIAAFCVRHGWLEAEEGWALVLGRDGAMRRGHESTYTDAFAVYGLAELYRATGDERWAEWARRSAEAAQRQLAGPRDRLPHFPYPIPPGAQAHGVPMIWSLSLVELGGALGESRFLAAGRALAEEAMRTFYRAEEDVMVEFVALDGTPWPAPRGTAVVPGHVIEDMWFQLHVLTATGDDAAWRREALRRMRRHLELGWDAARGGLRLAVDARGAEPVGWEWAELKLWWPHTEALYAVLCAWRETGEAEWLAWYERLWQLCLTRFVDWENGEWRQKLNADLTPWNGVVALPVKDPFHLPRSLLLQIELLERAGGAGGAQ